jgi:hypothetical protein
MAMGNSVYFITDLTKEELKRLRAELIGTAKVSKKYENNCVSYGIHLNKGRMTKSIALQFGIIIGAIQSEKYEQ